MSTKLKPSIRVEGLRFSFGSHVVLDGVDLELWPGEVVCLLGPNGVGKTTLIESLLGILPKNEGSVELLGCDPRKAPSRFWAQVGLVQQNWSDHNKWRVKDHLEWIRAQLCTATDRVMTVRDALNRVGLVEKSTTRLSQLSGGQRRIVDFAAATMAYPQLLLLDEPSTGLDPQAKSRLHDLILEHTDKSASILMTTHDLAEAEHLADRLLIMSRGKIIADGTVPELRRRFNSGAEIMWTDTNGTRQVHVSQNPEEFVRRLMQEEITELSINRTSLESAYLNIMREESR
ncbi:ATP-binding cassette domain-containing protein [Corynebacterium poyangense]|uniref:ATP-binding cassette domain-containing protein n=1 Tax=Corynebacterium poyangense TaxID=2684405 RepID=A0A7H0SR08_9CORY|nr:ABC transporter ATP-binding protein [Corynebacterium poyangense]MBZ8176403.1 ATP-binding cassette domain-containing protein [Corynebacterium poyangense]QNQ90983.1 ATP-binding cassette domain-containing protein [Corynebacterium poyangense]